MPDGSKRPYDLEGESSAMLIRHHADGLLETLIREFKLRSEDFYNVSAIQSPRIRAYEIRSVNGVWEICENTATPRI